MWSHIFLFGSLPRRRPPEFTAILMFEFWREATATSVPGLLCQSGRRRPENVSILSSLPWWRRRRNLLLKVSFRWFFQWHFRAIITNRMWSEIQANSPRGKFLKTISKFRERNKNRSLLFTFSIKREIGQLHVLASELQQRNIFQNLMQVQSFCFAYSTYCFFWRSCRHRRRDMLNSLTSAWSLHSKDRT